MWLCFQIAREHGIPFLETSAKSNINVEKAFMDLAQAILNKVNIYVKKCSTLELQTCLCSDLLYDSSSISPIITLYAVVYDSDKLFMIFIFLLISFTIKQYIISQNWQPSEKILTMQLLIILCYLHVNKSLGLCFSRLFAPNRFSKLE